MNVLDDPTVATGAPPHELVALLDALTALKRGDASVRLPQHWTGVAGKLADAFNQVVEQNATMAGELSRLRRVVGQEGRLKQRASMAGAKGVWGE